LSLPSSTSSWGSKSLTFFIYSLFSDSGFLLKSRTRRALHCFKGAKSLTVLILLFEILRVTRLGSSLISEAGIFSIKLVSSSSCSNLCILGKLSACLS
jgi:hypothetical protein